MTGLHIIFAIGLVILSGFVAVGIYLIQKRKRLIKNALVTFEEDMFQYMQYTTEDQLERELLSYVQGEYNPEGTQYGWIQFINHKMDNLSKKLVEADPRYLDDETLQDTIRGTIIQILCLVHFSDEFTENQRRVAITTYQARERL